MRLQGPQPLGEHHITTGFDCGDDRLNLWLQQRALGNQRSGATRTVVVRSADGAVKAYVALASGAVAVAASPGRFRRNMPDPIPVVVLARLAVCHSVQGRGIDSGPRVLSPHGLRAIAQRPEYAATTVGRYSCSHHNLGSR